MAWQSTGVSLKGPKGDQGERGLQGVQGIQGIPGDPGEDGKGIQISGQVATYAELPSGLQASDAGRAYLVEADGKLYVWSGTAFPANGSGADFRGPRGLQGLQGIQGEVGNTGAKGDKGDKGDTGLTGQTGQRGTKWFRGTGAPGTISNSLPGDLYLDQSDGSVYELS